MSIVPAAAARLARLGYALLAVAALAAPAAAATMQDGAKAYKPYIVERIGAAIAGAKELQAAVKAGDVKAAQAAWIKSRKGWEAMEPVTASYFGDLDKLIDAWPDGKTGYHAIEAVLFSANKTEGLEQPIADMLANMDKFEQRVKAPKFAFTPQKLLEGTANLAYEVGEENPAAASRPMRPPRSWTCRRTSPASSTPGTRCSPIRSRRRTPSWPALSTSARRT